MQNQQEKKLFVKCYAVCNMKNFIDNEARKIDGI
jgi:hypothetical protein